MRSRVIVILGFLCFLLIASGPQPIPGDKAGFIGERKSGTDFGLTIHGNGTAKLFQHINPASPDYDRLCIKVGRGIIEEMQVEFLDSDVLQVVKPTLCGKMYKVDRPPHRDGDSIKMVLNGVTLLKQ